MGDQQAGGPTGQPPQGRSGGAENGAGHQGECGRHHQIRLTGHLNHWYRFILWMPPNNLFEAFVLPSWHGWWWIWQFFYWYVILTDICSIQCTLSFTYQPTRTDNGEPSYRSCAKSQEVLHLKPFISHHIPIENIGTDWCPQLCDFFRGWLPLHLLWSSWYSSFDIWMVDHKSGSGCDIQMITATWWLNFDMCSMLENPNWFESKPKLTKSC